MQNGKLNELDEIRSHLVNISLVIASIAGLLLVSSSLFRATQIGIYSYFYIHIPIYLTIFLVTVFRKRLNYPVRALTLIVMIFVISAFDLVQIGFLSAAFLSFTVGVIITALYFDLRKSLWSMAFSIIYISIVYTLYRFGIISFKVDYNNYATLPITVIMLSLNIVLYGLVIAFSLRHIQRNLYSIIDVLKTKTRNLEETTIKLQNEIKERYSSEEKAINNEKNFRNIFEKNLDAILIMDEKKTIVDFNEAFLRMSGMKENDLLSMKYDKFISKDHAQLIEQSFPSIYDLPGKFEFDVDMPILGKKVFDCSTSIINYNGDQALLLMIRDFTEKNQLEKKNYLAIIEAEEKERLRFSKELHDGLGPLLSTLKIYLEVFFVNPADVEIRDRIESTLSESIKSVKEISNNISPYILENMGLIKAVNSFLEKIKYGKKIDIEFNSNLDFRIKPEIEISIYRFVTELINNTIKHANATKINISIEEDQQKLWIKYSDNGVGFDIEEVLLSSKGIGLFNLKSRIEKLGGKIDLASSPGNGFSVNAVIKIDQNVKNNEPKFN
jgi:PAS domain S-box-containing protein